MSDQPYGSSYEGHDPHLGQPGHRQQPPGLGAQDWEGYDEARHTQQWQGSTWETRAQPPVVAVDVTETAHLPPEHHGPAADDRSGRRSQPPQRQSGPAYQAPYGEPFPDQPVARQDPYQAQRQPQGTPYGQPQPYAQGRPQPYARGGQSHGQSRQPYGQTHPVTQAAHAPQVPHADSGPAAPANSAPLTAAQRARAEGRSPIIEPGLQPALLTAVLGALLAAAAPLGSYALLVPLVILQAVTAAGWFRLNGMWPARQGIALAFAGALTADAVLLAVGRDNAPAAILGTLGVWVLLTLVLQLRSHASPDERMYGLMATVASAALAIVAAGHLAAVQDAVTVGTAAVAAAIVVCALPLPTPASVVVSLAAGAGAGFAVGGMTDLGGDGALLGAAATVCALIGHRVASYDYPSRFVHFTAGVALPLTAAAPAVYLLGRALG